MNGYELKQLKTSRSKAQAEVNRLKAEVAYAQRNLQDAQERLKAVDHQIQAASSSVIVSEHAVLRYIERAMGVDSEEVRRKILSEEIADKIRLLGNGKFPIGGGMRAVVRDNVIVSVVEG